MPAESLDMCSRETVKEETHSTRALKTPGLYVIFVFMRNKREETEEKNNFLQRK